MDFTPVIENLPRLASGFWMTIQLTALSLACGLALAVPLALLRVSRRALLWMPAYGYIFFFRGTPLLIQIYLIYYGLGQVAWIKSTVLWAVFREAYWCALLGFSLNTAAYTAEILRGAIQAVPHGEVEAGRACGMSGFLLFRRIILPRAARLMLPAYSNEVVLMLQATSLASVVTLADLTGVARILIAQSFAIFEFFLTIGAVYLATTYVLVWLFRALERRLGRHQGAMPQIRVRAADLVGVPRPGR
jgi:octopine/nopaline transport system permease protein/arginine/ornithine transport system permease protein